MNPSTIDDFSSSFKLWAVIFLNKKIKDAQSQHPLTSLHISFPSFVHFISIPFSVRTMVATVLSPQTILHSLFSI